jgi:hypothetical protein
MIGFDQLPPDKTEAFISKINHNLQMNNYRMKLCAIGQKNNH